VKEARHSLVVQHSSIVELRHRSIRHDARGAGPSDVGRSHRRVVGRPPEINVWRFGLLLLRDSVDPRLVRPAGRSVCTPRTFAYVKQLTNHKISSVVYKGLLVCQIIIFHGIWYVCRSLATFCLFLYILKYRDAIHTSRRPPPLSRPHQYIFRRWFCSRRKRLWLLKATPCPMLRLSSRPEGKE
jgi:hypothetical protein